MISFFLSSHNSSCRINFSLGKFSHLPPIKYSYYATNLFLVQSYASSLSIVPYTALAHYRMELAYIKHLWNTRKFRIVLYRLCYWLLHNRMQNIWLLSDRVDRADDNGMHLFKHLMDTQPRKYNYYFCIRKDCPHFHSMKKIGKVVDFMSPYYRLLFLLSDKIISSSADEFFINPFESDIKYFRDLIQSYYISRTTTTISSYTTHFYEIFCSFCI